jgi:hypothetical protein
MTQGKIETEVDYIGRLQIPEGTDVSDAQVIRASYSYREEAYVSKRDRVIQNRLNWDTFNLKGDFTHKKRGQSREFLPKMALSVEQISSFFHQSMMDVGDWWSCDYAPGIKQLKIKPDEIQRLTQRQLEKMKFDEKIEDLLKRGLVESLCIAKVHGEYVKKPVFYTKSQLGDDDKMKDTLFRAEKRVWQGKVDIIRLEDFFIDPTGDGLFYMQQIEMDLNAVKELSRGPNAIYDSEVVDKITGGFEDMEQVARKARETGQNQTFTTYRKRVRLWEFWGTIIDPASGEVLHRDVTWTVANDRYLVQRPRPYPFWHGGHPFVICPILRTPNSVYHKSLMDAPTMLNIAMNEAYNLAQDAAIMAAFGIRQLRTEWLADETKVSDGIPPGETLEVNNMCPPGQKVLESVQTGTLSPEFFEMYNIMGNEFNQAAITNDLRNGQQSQRAVKATEVVEASQSITSLFTGVSQIVEQNLVVAILEKLWMTMCQNMNDMDTEEVIALIGKDRAVQLAAMSPEERFKETAHGYKFKVFGASLILNKMKDFKKLTSLLQTIASQPALMEEFIKKYDMGSLLTELMKALDIDIQKLELDPIEQAAMKRQQAAPVPQPNQQSQIPQVAGMGGEGNPGGPQPAQAGGGLTQ